MSQLDKIRQLKTDIYRIVNKYNVGRVYVFGSCARREDTQESDIDLLVEFHNASLFEHIQLENDMAALFQRPVDVVSLKALKDDAFGRKVRQEMVLL